MADPPLEASSTAGRRRCDARARGRAEARRLRHGRPHDFLFSAIEALIREQDSASPLIVSRLTREAAARARVLADDAAYEFTNWDTASKAVVRAMLNAGVLLSVDAGAISTGITAQATAVADLARNHRDRTEAFLIEFIIRRLGDVTTRGFRTDRLPRSCARHAPRPAS